MAANDRVWMAGASFCGCLVAFAGWLYHWLAGLRQGHPALRRGDAAEGLGAHGPKGRGWGRDSAGYRRAMSLFVLGLCPRALMTLTLWLLCCVGGCPTWGGALMIILSFEPLATLIISYRLFHLVHLQVLQIHLGLGLWFGQSSEGWC